MKLTATFRIPRIDFSAYQSQLKASMGDAIAHAAANWLSAVSGRIPVWSGASQATLLHLAQKVSFALAIAPVAKSRISLGLQNASGSIESNAESGRFTFTYATTLSHLVFNEYNNANLLVSPTGRRYFFLHRPGPYAFQEVGQASFQRFAKQVSLPSPFKAIKVTTKRV